MNADIHREFTKALFVHPWDLGNGEAASLMQWARSSNLDTLCVAATYHSGWLVQPHHASRRLRWSETGVGYFHPQEELYRNTCLRVPVAEMAVAEDHLRIAAEQTNEYGLRLVSWTVGAHNTRLGLAHPELAQHSVYGDVLPHALSLGHDDTRNYLKALVRDIAVNFSPYGIQLESFQWHSVRHNHAHERDLVVLTEMERQLLSLCFNPETVRKAVADGIDMDTVRNIVKATLEAAFQNAPERPLGHPESMLELESKQPELRRYNQFLKRMAVSLIQEIKQESLRGTQCKLYLQTAFDPALQTVCDGFAVWVYGQTAEQVSKSVGSAVACKPDNWKGEYHCYVRLGNGIPASAQQLRDIVLASRSAGATGVYFYNYSEAPPAMLGWLRSALDNI